MNEKKDIEPCKGNAVKYDHNNDNQNITLMLRNTHNDENATGID